MKSWFGYGLHVATKYEIPVAFNVTQASRAETEELNGNKLFEETLRCKDFGAGARQRAGEAAVRPVARASREEKNAATPTNRSSTTTSTREARCRS